MTPSTGTALVVLVAFVLPGYVCVLFQERTFKSSRDASPFERLLQALYYSLWCYLLLAVVALVCGLDREWFVHLYDRYQDEPAQLVWRGAAALLGSATAVWLGTIGWQESGANHWALQKVRLNARHQQPTGWDFFFRKRYYVHVKIVFADRNVYGYYGADSFASYAKDGRDLFLEYIFPEAKGGDGEPGFGEWDHENRGGWVNLADAISVEFYSPENDATTSSTKSRSGAEARGPGRAQESTAKTAPAPGTTTEARQVTDE
jgi:hypothetical protein